MNLKKTLLGMSVALAIAGCASTGYDSTSNYRNSDVIGNKDSAISQDRTLDEHYSLKILSSGLSGDNYVRVSSVSLDDLVVIAAISETSLKNKTFVNILKNSGTKPISNSLFNLSPVFNRKGNFKISNIKVESIENDTVHNYLKSLGYKDSKHLIERVSTFTYHNETMKLVEYILPSAEDYTNFYLMNAK